jgi:hypothetical protein
MSRGHRPEQPDNERERATTPRTTERQEFAPSDLEGRAAFLFSEGPGPKFHHKDTKDTKAESKITYGMGSNAYLVFSLGPMSVLVAFVSLW